jgi:hypothetical protein
MNLATMATWILTVIAGVLTLVIGKVQGFSLTFSDYALQGIGLLVICPIAFALYGVARPGFSFLVLPFHAFAQFSAFNITAWLLQFPLASLNLPAIDRSLIQLDDLLGNNWLAHFEVINADPRVYGIVELIYRALLFQVPLACAVVGTLDPRRLRILILANSLALSLTLAVATLWPAGGAFMAFFKPPYTASMAAQFVAVRDGGLRVLDPEIMTGIIAFPSYHTILAVLIGLSFHGLPRIFPVVAAFQFAIIVSARSMGGHYYADILAGILIACAANWAAEKLTDRAEGSGVGSCNPAADVEARATVAAG